MEEAKIDEERPLATAELTDFASHLSPQARRYYAQRVDNTVVELCEQHLALLSRETVYEEVRLPSGVMDHVPYGYRRACTADPKHDVTRLKIGLVHYLGKAVPIDERGNVDSEYVKLLARIYSKLVEAKKVLPGVLCPATRLRLHPLDSVTGEPYQQGEWLDEIERGVAHTATAYLDCTISHNYKHYVGKRREPTPGAPIHRAMLLLYPLVMPGEDNATLNEFLGGEFFIEEGRVADPLWGAWSDLAPKRNPLLKVPS